MTGRRFATEQASWTTRRLRLAVAAALVLLCVSCGGSRAPGAPESAGTVIAIENLEFAPETLRARVGDTITVQNKDAAEHTVTAVDGAFDTGRFGAGTKTFVVARAGRFEYFCAVHPFMAHRFIRVDP